jgi:integrase
VYLRERAPGLKHGRNVAKELAVTFWAYQGRPMSALADVCKAISLRSAREHGDKPLSPATIKNRISYLRAACRYAWKHHAMGEADPGARIAVPQVKNQRQHYIGRAEMLRLAKACQDKATRAAIRIAFYSGMRLGEIYRAEVIDGQFVLRDTKNGDPRIIPIHPRIRCCAQFEMRSRFVTNYHFVKARKAVGMSWLHFHDLRHSTASELINSGVDLYTVGAVLGHRSAASTKRYAHLATDRLNDAILKIGRRA